jgi:hypothetical protein
MVGNTALSMITLNASTTTTRSFAIDTTQFKAILIELPFNFVLFNFISKVDVWIPIHANDVSPKLRGLIDALHHAI